MTHYCGVRDVRIVVAAICLAASLAGRLSAFADAPAPLRPIDAEQTAGRVAFRDDAGLFVLGGLGLLSHALLRMRASS